MEQNAATDNDGFTRPLALQLTPFLSTIRTDRAPPKDRRHPRPRIPGDGFVSVMVGAALVAAVAILALD